MSKERLEEIKSRVWKDKGTYAMGDENQREGYIYTLSDYDYKWLIEQAKQVSALETTIDFYQSALRDADRRVQELENFKRESERLYKYAHLNAKVSLEEKRRLEKQNKRYREAIERIENTWKLTNDYQEYMNAIHDIIKELEDEE